MRRGQEISDIKHYLSNLWIWMTPCIILLSPMTSHAEWAQQSCGFPHRTPVTITAIGGSHSAETRINLVNADFPADYVFSSTGDDVRVFESDDTTPVDFVVAEWDDVARTANIYVRLPAISSGVSETIYIYLGDNGLGAGSNAAIFSRISA